MTELRVGDVVQVQPTGDRTCGQEPTVESWSVCQLPAGHVHDVGSPWPDLHADVSLSGVVLAVWPVPGPDELDDEEED